MNLVASKNYWIIVILITTLVVLSYFLISIYDRQQNFKAFLKYRAENENINYLGSIEQSHKNIFFIETSYKSDNGTFRMNARSACSIESAAKVNPDSDIYVLFTASTPLVKGNIKGFPILEALLSNYKNVRFKYIFVPEFTKGSPIQDFIISAKFNQSKFYNDHLSDALRLVVLWKYGGTYLDNDFFVVKPLDSLAPNYATKDGNHFNSAVLNLSYEGFGCEIAELMMEDMMEKFSTDYRIQNGPLVLTRVLSKICNTTDTTKMNIETCKGFNPLERHLSYPIFWEQSGFFVDEIYLSRVMEAVKDAMMIHTWNSEIKNKPMAVNSKIPYIVLAKQHCPVVMKTYTFDFF